MGLCVSSGPGNPSREETKLNVEIERNLQTLIKEEKKAKKVLLLGSAECGKSTLFKQMKIMHQNGYTPNEALAYKDTIFLNLLEGIQNVAAACLALKIPFTSPANEDAAYQFLQLRLDSPTAVEDFLQIQGLVKPLIEDEAFQIAIMRRHEYLHLDSAFYFFDHVDRILDPKEYIPTNDDILRSRVVTTGVIVTHFTHMQVLFQMYDVGGQRGERKKWIHCFDDVDAILFVSSLSEYDQVLREAPDANRLQESLTLFSGLISLPYFKKTQVILFLNKDDIFRTKVEQVDMGQYFPEYTGGCNYAAALDFIKFEFEKRVKEVGKELIIYVTNATDTNNFMKIWNAVRKVIVMNRLRASGLVSED